MTIVGLGMLLVFIKSLRSALWLVNDSAAVSLRYVLTRNRMTFFVFFSQFILLFFLLSSLSSHG